MLAFSGKEAFEELLVGSLFAGGLGEFRVEVGADPSEPQGGEGFVEVHGVFSVW